MSKQLHLSLAILALSWAMPAFGKPPRCPSRPTVNEVISAALAEQRWAVSTHQLSSIRRRAAWAAALPKLSARLSRSRATSAGVDIHPLYLDKIDRNDYSALRWEVRATWDLSKLIFSAKELQVARHALKVARRRQAIVEQVVRLYFERCRLLVMTEVNVDLKRQLELGRVTALLDSMTGGLLTKPRDHD